MKKPEVLLAGGVIRNSQGGILLLHRNTPSLVWWELPGGKVEPGEEPWDTVRRELDEELGIDTIIREQEGETTFTYDGIPYRFLWLGAQVVEGVPTPCEAIHDVVGFYRPATDLGRIALSPNAQALFEYLRSTEAA